DIDFAFSFNGAGSAEMRENGIYQSETTYAPGDIFRVAVVAGRVQYSKNGTLLRESEKAPEYPLLLYPALLTACAKVDDAVRGRTEPTPPGEGVLEKSGSPARRARFTRSQIEAFLPPDGARGAFTFPAPYNTTGVRLTSKDDCAGGQDCLW